MRNVTLNKFTNKNIKNQRSGKRGIRNYEEISYWKYVCRQKQKQIFNKCSHFSFNTFNFFSGKFNQFSEYYLFTDNRPITDFLKEKKMIDMVIFDCADNDCKRTAC